ncbi:MAG: hypothetical protein PHG85_06375, partial [Candidatus Altiarchaeota archaeon]|nr:hypothetical protein [Candidatus Altiarchaeota archaeon]
MERPSRLVMGVNPQTLQERGLDPTAGGGLKPVHDFVLFEETNEGRRRDVDASRFRVEDLNVEAKRALLVDDMERR